MQKQLKKGNLKKKPTNFIKKTKFDLLKNKRAKKFKSLLFLKKILKYSAAGRPFTRYKVAKLKNFLRLTINVMPNNIFCNLGYNKPKKTLKAISSGTYKIKTSKKVLRYNVKNVLIMFLKKLKEEKIKFTKFIAIKIIAPIRLRKQIVDLLSKFLFKKLLFKKSALLEIKAKKVFNGCRARKKQRKKRKGFRITK